MLGGFHVFVTVIIEISASNYAYFDGVRLGENDPKSLYKIQSVVFCFITTHTSSNETEYT